MNDTAAVERPDKELDRVPELDLERDFGQIFGDPVAKYEQDFHRFDALGDYLGEAPAAYRRTPPKKRTSIEAERAKAKIEEARRLQSSELRDRRKLAGRQVIGATRSDSVDATRENLKARAAEQHAD